MRCHEDPVRRHAEQAPCRSFSSVKWFDGLTTELVTNPLFRACGAVLFWSGLICSSTSAQSAPVRVSEISCRDCSITVRKIATLGTEDGGGAFASRPYSVARDAHGRFYVVTPETGGEAPFVFDDDGAFIRRLGRDGDGPGEYRSASVVLVGTGDTVRVIDRTGRVTTLDPSFEVAYTTPLSFSPDWSALRFANGTYVINGSARGPDRIGFPLHYVSVEGNLVRSFGDVDPFLRPGETHRLIRWLAKSGGGRLWSVPFTHEYAIELWDTTGVRVARLERDVDWFKPYDQYWLPTPDRAPAPRIMGIWQDARGFVWTIVHVGRPQWRRGLGTGIRLEGQMAYPITDEQRVYDTMVEVIDPAAGVVVASQRFPGTIDLVVQPNLVAAVREAPSGWLYLEILTVRLQRP